jgi:hypothetical protein
MLNTCEEHGGVLVYEGNRCPACDELSDKDETIKALEDQLEEAIAQQQ